MKVRDLKAQVNGCNEVTVMPSGGLEVVADDGNTLFEITLKGGVLRVSGGGFCQHGGLIYDHTISVKPVASNRLDIIKDEWA